MRFCRPVMSMRSVSSLGGRGRRQRQEEAGEPRPARDPRGRRHEAGGRARRHRALEHSTPPPEARPPPAPHYDGPMARASRAGEIALAAVVAARRAPGRRGGGASPAARAARGPGYAPVRTDRRERRPINSQGYRDLERAIPKPEGVRRAVCLGDSFTWGVSVLFDDAWPQRVERTLSRERGERWEAVNLAEPGLNTVQEASRLASEGFAYEPDVVIVAYVLNDSEDETAAEARRAADWVEERAPRPVRRRSSTARRSSASCGRGSGPRSRTAGGSRASARCTPTTTRAGRPPGARSRRWAGCAASGACPSSWPSSRSSATRSTTATPSRTSTRRWRRPRRRREPGWWTCCPSTAGSTGALLVVDGADDEHPNEIAHRIAARAIAQAVDEVVPRPRRGRAAPMSRSTSVALVAAAVALQAGLAVHAMRGSSATFDEGAHLPAGYTHLALGDHRLNPEQPPLVKLLAAAPLLAVRPVLKADARSWVEARQWEFGRSFLYRWNDADRLLFLGRLPIVALASCLVVAVFLEARRRFGDAAAAASLGLAALSPDVLAHGALVTTDLAFALFFFLSVVAFSRVVEEATPRRVARRRPRHRRRLRHEVLRPDPACPVLLLLGLARARAGAGSPARLSSRVGALAPASSSGPPTASAPPCRRTPRVRAAQRAPLEAPAASPLPRASAAAGERGARPGGLRARARLRDGALGGAAHVPARRALGSRLPALLPRHVPAEDARSPAPPHRPRARPDRRGSLAATPRSCGCRSSSTPRSPPPAACRSVTATSCPSTRSSSSRRARRRRGSGPGGGPPASRSWPRSGSGTRAARCASTRTTSRTSTRSPAGRPTAGGCSWTRTSTGGRT